MWDKQLQQVAYIESSGYILVYTLEKKAEKQFNLIYSKIKRKSENSVRPCCF
jgi:hypothetical protein